MKRILLAFVIAITLFHAPATAQVSHRTNFYSVDSLFFQVFWNVGVNQQLQISVNQFTDSSFHPYQAGMWLYNRNETPNTWEDTLYVGSPCWGSYNDTTKRAPLRKVNVLQVRLVDTIARMIIKDSVYNIGIIGSGNSYPYQHHVLFATGDSEEIAYMMGNSKEEIKLKFNLQILNSLGKKEVDQPVEARLAGGSSLCLPNKGISFKATNKAPINGPKKMQTTLFGPLTDEYKIKNRSGGSGQAYAFGYTEIAQRILDYEGWKIGGVKNTVSTWYLNGSYESLTFSQRKADERYVANEYGVDKDSVDIVSPIPFQMYFDTMYSGDTTFYLTFIDETDTVYFDTTFYGTFVVFSDSVLAHKLGFQQRQFFPSSVIDFTQTVIVRESGNKKRVVAMIDEGTNVRFQPIAQSLINLLPDSTADHYNDLITLLDLDSWLRYICIVHYFTLYDAISNNVSIGITSQNKAFILAEDFDDIQAGYGGGNNNWTTKILKDNNDYYGFMHEVIQRLILKSPKAISRLILVYQDMLNTGFLPSRTTSIVDTMHDLIMPEYSYYNRSWGGFPNGGSDSASEEVILDLLRQYVETRFQPAFQMLTNQWQPLDSFQFARDAKNVSIIIDSVSAGTVTYTYNSLKNYKRNYSGYYFPNPDAEISYVSTDPNVYIKEYPDSSRSFKISPDSTITITFVRRPDIVLPIELASFTCSSENNQIRLQWVTISEFNSNHFTIERSANGSYYDSIGIVLAAGNSSQSIMYGYVDTISNGYYRLKQVDNNGQFVYSTITYCKEIATDTPQHQNNTLNLYPNPADNFIFIKGTGMVTIISNLGEVILKQNVNNSPIDISLLSKGIYVIQLIYNETIFTGKFIKN